MPIYSRSGNFEIIERGDPPHIGFHFWSLHAPWTKSACNMPLHLGCGVKSVSLGMFILKIKTSIRNAHGIDVANEVCKQTMHFCKLTFVTPTNFVVLETLCFAQNQNLLRFSSSWTNGANFGEQGRSAHVCCPNTREHEFDRFFKVLLCPTLQLKRFQSSLNQFDSASPECDKIVNLKCFQINFVNFDQSFSTFESILVDLISSSLLPLIWINLNQPEFFWVNFDWFASVQAHVWWQNPCNVFTASETEITTPNSVTWRFLDTKTDRSPLWSNFCTQTHGNHLFDPISVMWWRFGDF